MILLFGTRIISGNGKNDGYPLSTNALNATRAGNTANAANATLNAPNTAVPVATTKLEDNAWLS